MENLAAGEVSLHGKVVLVTGGAQGIGQAIARLAQQCGAQIVSCAIRKPYAAMLRLAWW